MWEFLQQNQVVGALKKYSCLKKTRHHRKLRNLAPFCLYVREDARVWAHWNHSFHVYLSSLGLIPRVFPSWVSKVLCQRGCSSWLLEGLGSGKLLCLHPEFLQGSCGGCNVLAWWPQHPLFTDMAGNILVFSFLLIFFCFLSSTQDLLLVLVAVWGTDGEWNPLCHSSLYILCVYGMTRVLVHIGSNRGGKHNTWII